jgi:hypothetical protein
MRTWRHRRPHYATILFGCCLLLARALASEAKGDLDHFDLEGKVRTVVTTYPQLRTTHRFDRAGRLTSIELLPFNHAGPGRYVYLYD